MLTEPGAAFDELRDDAATRVVLVTGATAVFSAVADAPLSSNVSPGARGRAVAQRKSQFRGLFERANTLLENLEQPTIAIINGHAIGGGFFFSSRRRHTRWTGDWSSDVCSSD